MHYFTFSLIGLFIACSQPDKSPDYTTKSVWIPGSEVEVFQANPEDCSPYAFGYFGCKQFKKSIPLGLSLSSNDRQTSNLVAKRIHLSYVFQCASAHSVHAYIALEDGEIELSSTRSREAKPLVIATFKDISSLNFLFPAHTKQIDTQCGLVLTSWYALPDVDDLQKNWDNLRERLRLLRTFSNLLGPSPNKTQTIIALKSIRNSFLDDREDLKDRLRDLSDAHERQLTSLQILRLNQKIGDSDCGINVSDCGLTLAIRNLESCEPADCDSFVGASQAAIEEELELAKKDREALYKFIEDERKRLQDMRLSIDGIVTTLFQQIEADRHEV